MNENVLDKLNSRLRTKQKSFYNKTFSKSRFCWMHDLYMNFKPVEESEYPYFHVFINVNTRFACVYPVKTKKASEAYNTLTKFLKDNKCKKLISDAEAAFTSKQVLDTLKKLKIDVQINDEQNHKSLCIIDRFIRTIRDKHGSNTPISVNKMNKIINDYNNTVHSSLGYTPSEMQNDKRLEINYIIESIRKQNGIENAVDYKLHEGDYVRLIKEKVTNSMKLTKKRRTITKHYYIVGSVDKNRIVVSARDGSTKTVSRSDCVLIPKSTPLTQAKTIGDGSRGIIKKIVDYDPRNERYKVVYEDSPGYWYVSLRNIRAQFPNRITPLELEFFKTRT